MYAAGEFLSSFAPPTLPRISCWKRGHLSTGIWALGEQPLYGTGPPLPAWSFWKFTVWLSSPWEVVCSLPEISLSPKVSHFPIAFGAVMVALAVLLEMGFAPPLWLRVADLVDPFSKIFNGFNTSFIRAHLALPGSGQLSPFLWQAAAHVAGVRCKPNGSRPKFHPGAPSPLRGARPNAHLKAHSKADPGFCRALVCASI